MEFPGLLADAQRPSHVPTSLRVHLKGRISQKDTIARTQLCTFKLHVVASAQAMTPKYSVGLCHVRTVRTHPTMIVQHQCHRATSLPENFTRGRHWSLGQPQLTKMSNHPTLHTAIILLWSSQYYAVVHSKPAALRRAGRSPATVRPRLPGSQPHHKVATRGPQLHIAYAALT